MLLFAAFLPFPTRMMSEWEGVIAAERVAVVFYGIVLLVMVLMLIVLGRHAEREGLFGDDLADERKEEARVKYQLMPSLIAYVVAALPRLLRRRGSVSSSTCSSPSTWRSRCGMSAGCSAAPPEPLTQRVRLTAG